MDQLTTVYNSEVIGRLQKLCAKMDSITYLEDLLNELSAQGACETELQRVTDEYWKRQYHTELQ